MPRHSTIVWMMLAVALLTACGGAPAATAPTTVSVPTVAPAPTNAPTTVPAPTVATATLAPAASTPLADTNPAKPDDKAQGRLRISNCIYGGDSVDMLIHGKLIGETSGTFVANGTRVMSVPKLIPSATK